MTRNLVEWHTPPGTGWTFVLLGDSMRHLEIEPRGVLHIGAHHGEEMVFYRELGFKQITLVEPDPVNFKKLRMHGDADIYQFAVSQDEGPARFYHNQRSYCSGLKPNDLTPTVAEFEVERIQAWKLQRPEHNVLVVDTQGTELDALASADLSHVELVIMELTDNGGSAADYDEAIASMAEQGWEPAIRWQYDDTGFYEMLFVKAGD